MWAPWGEESKPVADAVKSAPERLAAGEPPAQSSILHAVLLMLLAGLCSSLLHICVRHLSPVLPSIEIVALRSWITLLFTLPVLLMSSGEAWRTRRFDLHVIRGFIGVASMWSWYYALGNLPLADAGALSFTTGLFVTLGAALYFREKVGPRRWSAVAVGFLGALVILKPGTGIVSWPAIWAVASSALWGASLLMSKQLARYDRSITITFYQPLVTAPIALALAIPGFVWPDGPTLLVLTGMGLAAAIGNFCYVHAMRVGEASLVMPADYVRLVWMAGWGFLFFAEVPMLSTWVGALLIVGATLFITLREAQLARERRRTATLGGDLERTST